MNWHRVIMTLQEQAKNQLTEAKQHADDGSLQLGSTGLVTASILLALADALREGLREERGL
jgi:hypothetical protein